MKKSNSFYVGIPNSEDVRTDLLNSSKAIISSLKRYGNYKKIREEKLELIKELGGAIKDLNLSIGKISSFLPEEIPEEKPRIMIGRNAQRASSQMFRSKEIVSKPKRIEELFEQKLEEIERRLNELK